MHLKSCASGMLGQNFLVVELWDLFSDFGTGGRGDDKKKNSENDQLTFFLFRAFLCFFVCVFLKSPEQTITPVK